MQIDAVRQLLQLSDALSETIMRAMPGETVSEAEFRDLVARRDRLTVALNAIIGNGFRAGTSGEEMEALIAELGRLTERAKKATATIQAVKVGVDVAGQALTALAKVVAFLV